jgi:predicted DNA-binding transcriptional regulator AlpA
MNPSSNSKSVVRDDERQRIAAHLSRKLSVREAAAYLGLSGSALNKTRLNGSGPPYLKLGRRVVYDLQDIEAWVAERKRRHTSQQFYGQSVASREDC